MFHSKRSVWIGLTILAAGCASTPPKHLVDARAAYQRAASGPAESMAPAQLHAAETSLRLAEKTFEDEGESANASDRAYVALRKAQLAEVQGRTASITAASAQADERGEVAAQSQHAATAQLLAATQAELVSERQQLAIEAERRKGAEAAQQETLAALGDVKRDQRGTVITLSGSVIFANDGSELLPAARNRVADVATALSRDETTITVEGHTDSKGSSTHNEQLSMQRAESVRDSLVEKGVDAARVKVVGYGETRPVADNGSESGRANNRRVEIVVHPESGDGG